MPPQRIQGLHPPALLATEDGRSCVGVHFLICFPPALRLPICSPFHSKLSDPLTLTIFLLSPLLQLSWILGVGVFHILGLGSEFEFVMVFYSALHLLQMEVSLMMGEDNICG